MNFADIPGRILDHIGALDEIRIAQPHFLPRRQAKIFWRWNFHEIIALDVELAGEGNLSRAGRRIFGIVDRLQFLHFALWIVGEDNFQRPQHRHAPLGALVEVLAQEILQELHVDGAVHFVHADVRAKRSN